MVPNQTESKEPNAFFAWCASGQYFSSIFLIFMVLALCGIYAGYCKTKSLSRAETYPGKTTINLNCYVPSNHESGNFDPGGMSVDQISLERFKEIEGGFTHKFSSFVINPDDNMLSVKYYAKNENATQIFQTELTRTIPIAKSQWWKFAPKQVYVYNDQIFIRGEFVQLAQMKYMLVPLILAVFGTASMVLFMRWVFKVYYPQWKKPPTITSHDWE